MTSDLAGAGSCSDLSGRLLVVDKNGEPITAPLIDENTQKSLYYPTEYPLTFTADSKGCLAKINGMDKLIVTNRAKSYLDTNPDLMQTAKIYGGLGNKLELQINNLKKQIPIEPVGIIVLAIDGLRQDVLYPDKMKDLKNGQIVEENFEAVNDHLPGAESKYYVDASSLAGLGQILIGNPKDATTQSYVMLPNVTSVFPSITLASWASIFTGEMPNKTGIMGNEFFARDLLDVPLSLEKIDGSPRPIYGVPDRYKDNIGLKGIISFASGAFRGFDNFSVDDSTWYRPNKFNLTDDDFITPYQFNWKEPVEPARTPQNNKDILKSSARTIFEQIKEDQEFAGMQDYYKDTGTDVTVVADGHYSRGADYWVTWDMNIPWSGPLNASKWMDGGSWDKFDDYLCGKYTFGDCAGLRNDIKFSPLTVWYLPGLDHEAHIKSMGAYKEYFTSITDGHINSFAKVLTELDEFDNKIFIVVADHGMTEMPTDLKFPYKNWIGGTVQREAETSCTLELDFNEDFNQKAEKANNNLHIWELAELFRAMGKMPDVFRQKYNVLAPKEILILADKTYGYGATSDINTANVIASLNGPMAHIYLRDNSSSWSDQPSAESLSILATDLKVLFQDDGTTIDEDVKLKFNGVIKNLFSSVEAVLIRTASGYRVFNGYNKPTGDVLSLGEEYVKILERLTGLNDKQRSGDIVLIMKDKTSDGSLQRFTTGVACKSWHGSMNKSDSYVPFIAAYPAGNRSELEPLIESVTGCTVADGCEGNWQLPDIVKSILGKQYNN